MARRRSGKKIDFVHWTAATATVGAQAAGTIATTMATALHLPETLMRMRGEVVASLDFTQAPGAFVRAACGIILVPEGTGTTVLWSPFTDSDAPWIWTGYYHLGYEEMVTDVVDVPTITAVRDVIDNKAMRIIRNQEIQFVLENSTLLAAAAVNVNLTVRILSGK